MSVLVMTAAVVVLDIHDDSLTAGISVLVMTVALHVHRQYDTCHRGGSHSVAFHFPLVGPARKCRCRRLGFEKNSSSIAVLSRSGRWGNGGDTFPKRFPANQKIWRVPRGEMGVSMALYGDAATVNIICLCHCRV
jgi:hypothetical protein